MALQFAAFGRRNKEDEMRNFLLASVATLATGGLTGAALAQAPAAPAAPVGAPNQGQVAYPAAPAPVSYVNENNNYQAPMLPGPLANPTPGTIVVHINAKVQVDVSAAWSSADTVAHTAPAGSPGAAPITSIGTGGTSASAALGAILGNNGTGTTKVQPQDIESFARLYFGADGMATNGLRYGAAIEVRQNFIGEQSGASASTYLSSQTLFVRRAFTYVAGDQWGIVRAGEADGLIGIFDNGVTTFQFLPTGNFNGGDTQSVIPSNAVPTWVWMSQAGGDYGNAKVVYMSPQIAGFDFGLQYAPNTSNGFGMSAPSDGGLAGSLTGSGNGTGAVCTISNSGCPDL
ncbi:MAG TPA: porin, partial [Acetobacteraceae bacterium]|nr:porin [Acetobacteraceae bacterium]